MNGILNHRAAKACILNYCKAQRPTCGCARVSKDYLSSLEGRIKALIVRDVQSHPSIGKTFKP